MFAELLLNQLIIMLFSPFLFLATSITHIGTLLVRSSRMAD